MMTDKSQLDRYVADWCRLDKDKGTVAVIKRLVEQNDEKELQARLGHSKSTMNLGRASFD